MELAQSTLSASFIDKGAKQLLLKLLARLEQGQLVLHDGSECHRFGKAGSDLHAELVVQDPAFYRRLLLGGSIAAGETWVEGLWTSPEPVALVRLLARNLPLLDALERRLGWLSFPFNKVRHWFNRNTLTGSRANIAAHYDLGNTLYQGFLDDHMQYSSAIYPHPDATLEEGQQAKLRTICERLELGPDDHLLEIGTGWGGLAVYAARHYGCRVTTTTISRAQHDYAKAWIEREGLGDRITLLLEDYRKLEGRYDKLVSIEMIEAVGHAFLPDYFRQLSRLLKPGGRLLIQAITIADQRHAQYLRGVDFIQRYIFPAPAGIQPLLVAGGDMAATGPAARDAAAPFHLLPPPRAGLAPHPGRPGRLPARHPALAPRPVSLSVRFSALAVAALVRFRPDPLPRPSLASPLAALATGAVRHGGGRLLLYGGGRHGGSKLTLGHLDKRSAAGGDLDVVVTRTPVGNGQAGG